LLDDSMLDTHAITASTNPLNNVVASRENLARIDAGLRQNQLLFDENSSYRLDTESNEDCLPTNPEADSPMVPTTDPEAAPLRQDTAVPHERESASPHRVSRAASRHVSSSDLLWRIQAMPLSHWLRARTQDLLFLRRVDLLLLTLLQLSMYHVVQALISSMALESPRYIQMVR
jgi:hypothetical protein